METATKSMGAAGAVLLILAFVCWVVSLISLSQVVGRSAHGDAVVGQAIAFFTALGSAALCWLWLGGLLLKAHVDGAIPSGTSLAVVLLYFASAAGIAAAFYLIQDPRELWPAGVPVLIPLLVAGIVIAAYQPALRGLITRGPGIGIGAVVLLLSLAPWPSVIETLARKSEQRAAHVQAQQDWEIEEKARRRAENLARLEAMSSDQPVINWYGLLEDEGGVRAEAFEKLRHVARRQADIEDMLSYGIPKGMMLLPDLDLEATPRLCAAAQSFLRKHAQDSQHRPEDAPAAYTSEGYVTESLPAIHWLRSRGCNCDEGLAAVDAMVRTYLDSPERRTILAALTALRRPS